MSQVTIVRREPTIDPADPEGVRPALRVTYSTAALAPRAVYVSGENPTEQQVAEAIRQDLAAAAGADTGTLEV